ncbi:MAG: response regulator [Candidatus Omnitrophica bacterium]|nr:response regulator [Candidatus Omnitrophota bacterium]MCM8827189.1 response regulator [Candidatus Omnitrophota bacterium]
MIKDVYKKILIVDDEEEFLEYLDNILKSANYDVIKTSSGREALALAKSNLPDLIILDLLIPDKLGSDIAEELSKEKNCSKIPIIFITGLNTKEDEKIIREKAGNYYLLAKPLSREEILATVKRVFKERKV